MISLRYIEIFARVVQLGSYSSAAKYLGISQPAVSKAMSYLEQRLGLQLFAKQGNRLTPTQPALQLQPYVDEVLAQVNSTYRLINRLGVDNELRIAASPAYVLGILPLVIPRFIEACPNVRLNVYTMTSSSMLNGIKNSNVDFAIGMGSSIQEGIHQECLGVDELVALVPLSHPLSGRSTISLHELSEHDFISVPATHPVGELFSRAFKEQQIPLRPCLTIDAFDLSIRLAEQGVLPTVASRMAALKADPGLVKSIPLTPRIEYPIMLRHQENMPISDHVQCFTDLFKSTIENRG